ncbi:hypothetical protein HK101_001963 [Irineochytrium annulatum]|nr:hypothetical protein HK101_001963 [Irineochytrium annulatum]
MSKHDEASSLYPPTLGARIQVPNTPLCNPLHDLPAYTLMDPIALEVLHMAENPPPTYPKPAGPPTFTWRVDGQWITSVMNYEEWSNS